MVFRRIAQLGIDVYLLVQSRRLYFRMAPEVKPNLRDKVLRMRQES
jgi:hypothetical protein